MITSHCPMRWTAEATEAFANLWACHPLRLVGFLAPGVWGRTSVDTVYFGPEAEFFVFKPGVQGEPATVTHDVGSYFDLAPADLEVLKPVS